MKPNNQGQTTFFRRSPNNQGRTTFFRRSPVKGGVSEASGGFEKNVVRA